VRVYFFALLRLHLRVSTLALALFRELFLVTLLGSSGGGVGALFDKVAPLFRLRNIPAPEHQEVVFVHVLPIDLPVTTVGTGGGLRLGFRVQETRLRV